MIVPHRAPSPSARCRRSSPRSASMRPCFGFPVSPLSSSRSSSRIAAGRALPLYGARPRDAGRGRQARGGASFPACRVGRVFIICHMLSGGLAALAALMVVVAQRARRSPPWRASSARTGCCRPSSARCSAARCLPAARVSVFGTFLGAAARDHAHATACCSCAGRRVLGAGLPGAPPAPRPCMLDRLRALLARRAGGSSDGRHAVVLRAHRLVRPARRRARRDRRHHAAPAGFLSPFNIQVLLLAVARQHAGRLVADDHHRDRPDEPRASARSAASRRSPSPGMMQVWGLPAAARALIGGLGIGLVAGLAQRRASSPAPGSRPSSSRWRASRCSRASISASPSAQPFYGVPESRQGLRRHDLPRPPALARSSRPRSSPSALLVPAQPPDRSGAHPGRRRQPACRRAVRHLASTRTVIAGPCHVGRCSRRSPAFFSSRACSSASPPSATTG